jgi:hypothetical protein
VPRNVASLTGIVPPIRPGGPSRIAIVDRNSGRYIKTLLLRTTGHVGGLCMTQSGHLWVAANKKLFR